jgi:DNA polymerase I
MIETVLVDADIVAYRCAAATENETQDIATWQTSEMMNRILHETNAMQYRCFLSGSDNFRYSIYPDYKANRRDMPRPKWLQQVREHLVSVWGAVVTDGIEADDAMGIAQCAADGDTCIASIDKDMLMIPGHHYNFVKQEASYVTPLEGLRNFYFQLIMGDRADNIFGFDGKARQKVPKFLEPQIAVLEDCQTEQEMFEHVRAMYNDDERLEMNAKCLWIMRKPDEVWVWTHYGVDKETMDGGSEEVVHH